MRNYKTLKVWEKSHSLVMDIYKSTQTMPKEEVFGLTSQIRRAVTSIPKNIAEGCGRSSNKDFSRFLTIALGSASEVSYLLLLISDLNLIDISIAESFSNDVNEIMKMLTGLQKSLIT